MINRVKAEYRSDEFSFYQGNPYIEALPPLPTRKNILGKFTHIPKITKNDRLKPAMERVTALGALRTFSFPMERYVELTVDIYSLIKQRYYNFNPARGDDLERMREVEKEVSEKFDQWLDIAQRLDKKNSEEVKESELLELFKTDKEVTSQNYEADNTRYNSTAENLLFIGVSGVGKTTALERCLWFLPDIISHTEYKGKRFIRTQIPLLRVEVPHEGKEKELCLSILNAFDEILGNTRYYETALKATKKTAVDFTIQVGKLTQKYGVGMICFDEAQNLIRGENGGKRLQGFILFATNLWKVPFILTGTPKMERLFNSTFKALRRICSFGSIKWDRLPKGRLFEKIVETLWKVRITRNESPLTEDVVDTLYEYSQGIIQMVVSLFIRTQRNVLMDKNNKEEIIRASDIKRTFIGDFEPVHKAISALAGGNYKEMEKFGDLMFGVEKNFAFQSCQIQTNLTTEIDEQIKKQQTDLIKQEILTTLSNSKKTLFPSLGKRDLKNITNMIVKQHGIDCPVQELITFATREATLMDLNNKEDLKVRRENKKNRKNDGITAENKEDADKSILEKKGFIGERDELLI